MFSQDSFYTKKIIKLYNRDFYTHKIFSYFRTEEIQIEIIENKYSRNELEILFDYPTNTGTGNEVNIDELNFRIICELKKIHILNNHILINFNNKFKYSEQVENILEISNYSLCPPLFKDVPKYLQVSFDTILSLENLYFFSNTNLEFFMLFHDFNLNEFCLDTIICENNCYNAKSNFILRDLLKDANFNKNLLNFSIKIKDAKDLNKVRIINENEKSLIIIINYNNYNDISDLISNINEILRTSYLIIKEKNLFLVMDQKEREILKIYKRNYSIISESLLSFMKFVIYFLL